MGGIGALVVRCVMFGEVGGLAVASGRNPRDLTGQRGFNPGITWCRTGADDAGYRDFQRCSFCDLLPPQPALLIEGMNFGFAATVECGNGETLLAAM